MYRRCKAPREGASLAAFPAETASPVPKLSPGPQTLSSPLPHHPASRTLSPEGFASKKFLKHLHTLFSPTQLWFSSSFLTWTSACVF